MLYTGAAIIFDIFLDLGAFFAERGLVDWHLHRLFPIRHHDRSQRGIFCVQLFIIYRPESVKLQTLLVPKKKKKKSL